MNADKNIFKAVIDAGIKQVIAQFKSNNDGGSLSDIYIRIDSKNGKLLFFDDMENPLSDKDFEGQVTEKQISAFCKEAKAELQKLNKEGVFDGDFIFKPFSVSLIDESFIIQEELLFLDDENLKLNGESLMDLDKELNDFLNNLLKDLN